MPTDTQRLGNPREQRIRNVAAPVRLLAAVLDERSDEARHLDPVCRMLVADGHEAGSLRYDDTLSRFCSLECAGHFLRDPNAYAPRGDASCIPERGLVALARTSLRGCGGMFRNSRA